MGRTLRPRAPSAIATSMFHTHVRGTSTAQPTSGTTDTTETELGAKLTVPVGAYTGCITISEVFARTSMGVAEEKAP